MTDREITEKLLNGASLRTFMVPDELIPSNYPQHLESYDLPHIIINGEHFWGKSFTSHLFHSLGASYGGIVSFSYTNIGNIFTSYSPYNNGLTLMSKNRYKTHIWILKENYRLIWDSERGDATASIKKEIEFCSKFKIAMLDSEEVWNIHPVDLPMFYSGEGKFQLKTVMDSYPLFFRYPDQTKEIIDEAPDFFNTKPVDNESGVIIDYTFQKFFTLYVVSSDGTYSDLFDLKRGTSQKYKRLKVYVDRV